jgi:hypothetical protein
MLQRRLPADDPGARLELADLVPPVIRRLLHFLLLGALLFALDRREPARVAPLADGDEIVVDAAAVAERWRDKTGAAPDGATLATLVSAEVDEEVLVREALRAGLDRTDAVVWRRLVDNLRFVSTADTRDETALQREARRLGMERSDPVVRKRLVERMRETLRAVVRADEPTETEIAAWLETHGDRSRRPDRVRLAHVFFSRARRGERALADARATAMPPRGGDPFLHGAELGPTTARELERMIGPTVASAAFAAERGNWRGPIESPYGAHWILVRERIAGEAKDARREAITALRGEREDRALRELIAKLRSHYPIASPLCGEDDRVAGG